ncbi:hypothetical protein M427DRAFT_55987 [Gonapodya prolifera JEL478]|uniref:GOLD domain-containing protein n=1 Tax=Gonapodya prolifera (strain JEL478) TaxID=1344416 RepID=A0A139AGZ1_GONPJ|nr:hypothetical protein M427DRAFT_55987 [Gonapodya prolifera JEL478]|eukprot:KXS16081.1 hypothetical protein M427DRAFT_55987 [Gonapodya prolifera JEL478]
MHMSLRGPLFLLFVLAILIPQSRAVYFYLEGNEQRCLIEELAQHTVVRGNYRSEEWSNYVNAYVENYGVGIQIRVDEAEDGTTVLNQKGGSSGRFTFTATDSGDYNICFGSNSSTWFTTSKVRLHIDITLGDSADSAASSQAKESVSEIAMRIRDLNFRINNIRREQQYQREREAEFRDTSESTNSRVVWYTLAQIIVLAATAFWQTRHLKTFFVAKKLV